MDLQVFIISRDSSLGDWRINQYSANQPSYALGLPYLTLSKQLCCKASSLTRVLELQSTSMSSVKSGYGDRRVHVVEDGLGSWKWGQNFIVKWTDKKLISTRMG
ncbi:hypothetical protein RRG08_023953 [Elysia crispata]|uniref:Uncharacterized protein n=1 Tax=Elysia crispata TaxID=231223 RepID=A0AAE0YNF4_9GAST|nr:hypothetical protein RRG08_023953 [Elysia crispata]